MGLRSSRQSLPNDGLDYGPDFQGDIYGQNNNRLPNDNSNQHVGRSQNLKHPVAALFHVAFKLLAFLFYLFGGLFGQEFITTFVAVILLVSMDFWVVKNVTGRLMAGLRWSNYIDDLGNSHWIFENKNATKINETTGPSQDRLSSLGQEIRNTGGGSSDASLFWSTSLISTFFWSLFLLISIFRLNVQWFMLVLVAFVLSITNLYGYIRCRLGTSDIKNSVTKFVAKQVFQNFITGGGGGNSTPSSSGTTSNKPGA